MPLNARYVALSYVWGQTQTFQLVRNNVKDLRTEGSLDQIRPRLPQTIRDAMTFVESLGERYLWVDTLCLVQDDENDVGLGIELMNSIFQGSYFTLVAGSGDHANSGLPGARPHSRNPRQLIAQITPTTRMAVVHGIDWHLGRSVYGERGWTLQELVLPRRTVIFTNNQVHFRCMNANWSEDTLADRALHWLDPDDSNISRIPSSAERNVAAWWTYQKLCEDYSTRLLRFESDALRAVAGILRPLTASLRTGMLEGLPELYLDMALLFISSDGNLRRRDAFASYSWAGWTGRIMWPRENYLWPESASESDPSSDPPGRLSSEPAHLFRWFREKTLVKWSSYDQAGTVNDLDCHDGYKETRRIALWADEYAAFLPPSVVCQLHNLPCTIHRGSFNQPTTLRVSKSLCLSLMRKKRRRNHPDCYMILASSTARRNLIRLRET